VIDQETLEAAVTVDTGWVFGTNVMPDGSTMLLHDATGGILVLRDIADPRRIRVERRLDVLGTDTEMDTLGGKGNFVDESRYLCCGWKNPRLYAVNPGTEPSWSLFLEDPRLAMSDDLVVSRDRTRAYCACYGGRGEARVAVVDVARRTVASTIPTGAGTCGLTMSDDERFVIASADADDAIAVIDTGTDAAVAALSARGVLAAAGIRGYLQGISARGDDVYVYGCSGNGALAVFHGLGPDAEVTVTWPGGRRRGKAEVS
jgi:DNA-binding beta-propeller fold protein YncE